MSLCPLCGSKARKQLKLPHTIVWECLGKSCGLQFAFPQLGEADLGRAYRTHYYPSNEKNHPAKYQCSSSVVLRQVLLQLERSLGRLRGLRLLDYGCGAGPILSIAHELGMFPVGIEPNAVARSTTARSGVTIFANLDELRSQRPAAQFDLIILWNVIEHLREPWSDLQELRGLVCPRGQLLVSTMNVECLRARFERRRWMNYENPTHLYYFSRRSLEGVIASAGFARVREWKPKIHYPDHGKMRRWLYEASSLFGVSDGLYYLCAGHRDVSWPNQLKRSRSEETTRVDVDAIG
jgi:2-polyprenyl-3-methyl-5-hydroxy-6-metoxy-1,4-benzoquinol methylase